MKPRIELAGSVAAPQSPPWGDGVSPTLTTDGWHCRPCDTYGARQQIAAHLADAHDVPAAPSGRVTSCAACHWSPDPHAPTTAWDREHESRHETWMLAQADIITVYADLEQRSPEWHAARCGVITASTVGKLVTLTAPPADHFPCPECSAEVGAPCVNLRGGKPIKTMHAARTALAADAPAVPTVADNDTSRAIIATLAAERISGRSEDTPTTADMWRGVESEPFAREAYEQWRGVTVDEVAFMVRTIDGVRIGCSPDGLVGDDGGIEIKSPRAKGHVLTAVSGKTPAHHMAQLQTFLLVTGRRWIDFISFKGGLALWSQRVMPDQRWHEAIVAAATEAEAAIQDLVARYREATRDLPMTDPLPSYDEITV